MTEGRPASHRHEHLFAHS